MEFNFQKIESGIFVHRQISIVNDRVYMRAKKRPAVWVTWKKSE